MLWHEKGLQQEDARKDGIKSHEENGTQTWGKIVMEKRFTKVVKNPKTGRTKTVKYGQAGKAKDGGDRIRPGTAKGDAYCARSAKIKGDWKSDPNSPNNLSRKKWKCRGSKSMK
jgi:hypothetical protein